jgi:hypothetical protein
MSEGPLLAAFKKRENIGNQLRAAKNRTAFNALLPQWTVANGNLQNALIKYVPEAVLTSNRNGNIKNTAALTGIINGLAQNKYKPFVGPLIAKFKDLKTRYQTSTAANPNYSGSLNSILQVLTNSGVNVTSARGVVSSNANMETKFEAVRQALTAASGQLKKQLAEKNASIARIQEGTAQNKAQVAAIEQQLLQEKQTSDRRRIALKSLAHKLEMAKAETSVAKAATAKAMLVAEQHSQKAEIEERRAKAANNAAKEAHTRATAANAAVVATKAAAEKAAANAAKASESNKAKAKAAAKVAAEAAAKALKEAQNAHAANKAAAAAALNEEKRARAANKAAANVAAAAAQKLHAAEATKARAIALAAVARSISAQRKATKATAEAAANRANRNVQVAAAKAQVEAEAAAAKAAVEAKAAAEAAANAVRTASAENKAKLQLAAAAAARNASAARQGAIDAEAQHEREKAELKNRLERATTSVAEKEAARAALQAEKTAANAAAKAAAENAARLKAALNAAAKAVANAARLKAAKTARLNAATVVTALTAAAAQQFNTGGAPAAAQLVRGSGTASTRGAGLALAAGTPQRLGTPLPPRSARIPATTISNNNIIIKNWNKFKREAIAYKNKSGQHESGNRRNKVAKKINGANNPLGKALLNAEWDVFRASTTQEKLEAHAKFKAARAAWEKNGPNIIRKQKFYEQYRLMIRALGHAQIGRSMNTIIISATAAALNKKFQNIKINTIRNSINSVTNQELKTKLNEMLALYEYKKLLNNARAKSNLKTVYNTALKEYNFRPNKPYNFNKIRTTMEALKAAMNNTQQRMTTTRAYNLKNKNIRGKGQHGSVVKNKLGKAYFVNRAGERYPVIGTKKGGGYIFNKTRLQQAQNYQAIVNGRIPIA